MWRGMLSENLPAPIPGRHGQAEPPDLLVDVVLVRGAQLRVAPAADAVHHGEVAEARLRRAERVERLRIPLVDRDLDLVLPRLREALVFGVGDEVTHASGAERGV